MRTVGWVGLGKLGLTCALALAHSSHENVFIHGYDVSDRPAKILAGEVEPFQEANIDQLLQANHDDPHIWTHKSIESLVAALEHNGIVFVSAPTPHSPKYGGETEPPAWDTKDFEYGYLISAVRNICNEAKRQQKYITLVIISTVLPGTSHKHLIPLTNPYVSFVYNPFFIAMGTTFHDFVDPEFVLLGSSDANAVLRVSELYQTVHDRPIRPMSVESAELTKVAYNTFISMKIVFANTVMEICQKTGADADEVCGTLAQADQRITSGAYMYAGMGDGGGCHPRDNIAMAHLAEKLSLHADPFTFVTDARTGQSDWLAEVVQSWHELTGLPVVVLGAAYKPESNLTLGSPALLLAEQLAGLNPAIYDPYIDVHNLPEVFGKMVIPELTEIPAIFFVGCKHPDFRSLEFPKGSVIIDPFGYMPETSGSTFIHLGRKK